MVCYQVERAETEKDTSSWCCWNTELWSEMRSKVLVNNQQWEQIFSWMREDILSSEMCSRCLLGGRRGAWACVCNARWGIVYSTVPYSTPVQWQWGPGDSEPGSAPLSTIFASFRRGQSRSDGRINLLIFIHLGRNMKLKIKSISF